MRSLVMGKYLILRISAQRLEYRTRKILVDGTKLQDTSAGILMHNLAQ
jgi:hypothetical protein